MPRCPSCDEPIPSGKSECPHCGEELEPREKPAKSSTTLIMIILGGVCLGLLVCCGILAALLLPAVQQAREAARRTQCKNNLKQIGLAMHNYHDTYRLFPAAHLNDDDGEPRLSWRISVLPYMDEASRYNRYQFNESWDSPLNATLANPVPVTYQCPSFPKTGLNSCYAAITGDDTVLGSGKCVSIGSITDGTSNTLMIVEACKLGIHWMKPQDIDEDTFPGMDNPKGISSTHFGGAHVLMTDGSVRFLSNQISPITLNALITRNKGETLMDF